MNPITAASLSLSLSECVFCVYSLALSPAVLWFNEMCTVSTVWMSEEMGEKDRNRISGEDLGWLDLLLSGVMSVGFVCVGNFCTIRKIGWWRTQNFCNRPKCGLKLLSKGNTLYSQYKLRSKKTVKCFYFVIQYSYYKLSIWKVEVKKLSKAHDKGIWLPEAVLMPLVQVHF